MNSRITIDAKEFDQEHHIVDRINFLKKEIAELESKLAIIRGIKIEDEQEAIFNRMKLDMLALKDELKISITSDGYVGRSDAARLIGRSAQTLANMKSNLDERLPSIVRNGLAMYSVDDLVRFKMGN